jgi:hypothetical protein
MKEGVLFWNEMKSAKRIKYIGSVENDTMKRKRATEGHLSRYRHQAKRGNYISGGKLSRC